uniref:Uncharacterized protein n=1 Tax=Sphaerodactylus townsendi TaxID=933632 RepID=A0ACB8EU94_9SAUR
MKVSFKESDLEMLGSGCPKILLTGYAPKRALSCARYGRWAANKGLWEGKEGSEEHARVGVEKGWLAVGYILIREGTGAQGSLETSRTSNLQHPVMWVKVDTTMHFVHAQRGRACRRLLMKP